ncbi:MAG: PIG-L family deacetylase, partial [Armatimonadota bacterium]|nr:PIG-L family deacetylase [Armatimonadota bacterium]
ALVWSLRQQKAHVTFAIGTRGGKGKRGKAKEHLESLRSRHQLDAARVLGGVEVVLFDYPDKNLSSHVARFASDLSRLIAQKKPDLVLAWDPEHIYNPHPDHQAAARAAVTALESTPCAVCYYGTTQPNLWLGFSEDVFRIKLKAIRAHRTEVPWFFYPLAKRFLAKKDGAEGAKIGSRYAETYRYPADK